MDDTGSPTVDRFRTAALIALLVGGGGSVGSMLFVGHRNPSRFLLALFTVWVLSPFAALVWAHAVSMRWLVGTRAALYAVMLVIALISLGIYGHAALSPPKTQAAAVFVVVPLASWLLIAIVIPIAAYLSGKRP